MGRPGNVAARLGPGIVPEATTDDTALAPAYGEATLRRRPRQQYASSGSAAELRTWH
jgi:hypothetical protein